jgi:parallel beta-helix repeat protein
MKTVRPSDGLVIQEDARLEEGVWVLSEGMRIGASGVRVDGSAATLVCADQEVVALAVDDADGCTLESIRIVGGRHGLVARRCKNLTVRGCEISGTAEEPPNTLFLDIWRSAEKPYGSAILLIECESSVAEANLLQHQQNGILTYGCKGLTVRDNQCNYNSGFGIHLHGTCDSLFEANSCDYCCRFEPREGGLHFGHMGADAAGFLIVYGSSRNRFLRNTARLGGDGFFLAGMTPEGESVGCDDNLFEENDGSLSPNIAFEATFSRGNVFRRNFADRCNYGFWCGFSSEFLIEENRMVHNRQAGIAVENGMNFTVRENTFQSCGHGVLIWTRPWRGTGEANGNAAGWLIESNRFLRNGVGIRIAANQDHGIRPLQDEEAGLISPHSHRIFRNDIQDNRIGIELVRARNNVIKENILNANVEANLLLADAEDNEIANNLGARGAYL